MIKWLTFWMEKDPAKDPMMDNVIRAVCLLVLGWIAYHAVIGIVERMAYNG